MLNQVQDGEAKVLLFLAGIARNRRSRTHTSGDIDDENYVTGDMIVLRLRGFLRRLYFDNQALGGFEGVKVNIKNTRCDFF